MYLLEKRLIDKSFLQSCMKSSNKISELISINNKILLNEINKSKYSIETVFDISYMHNLNILEGLENISSTYLLDKYIDNNLKYVKPVEILLLNKTINDTCHYIPILESHEVSLKNEKF